ncbi:MAG TPA: hemerythrin domain-containing protein [Burkholderiaceae bacterium]|nr:hemerythrin domain-containing protein [Burkholderiaceae bacterium]
MSLINRLEVALRSRNMDALRTELVELGRYAKLHFEREERVALEVGYNDVNRLHDSHDRLKLALRLRYAELAGTLDDAKVEGFVSFLRTWLIDHVIKEDMQLKPWIQGAERRRGRPANEPLRYMVRPL